MKQHFNRNAFTLIELSIVLVIFGLIIGGILVGKDLIEAAQVRPQISQIEKFQAAENTFRGKYNCLPGDCKNAAQFGFGARGTYPGQGDGNGILEGANGNAPNQYCGTCEGNGETVMFWVDLSAANLIAQSFTTATSTVGLGSDVTTINLYFPTAQLNSNFVYAYSNGGANYFGISAVSTIGNGWGLLTATPAIKVQHAYSVDQKIDDGFPQTGNVTAKYVSYYPTTSINPVWAGAADTSATAASASTCYDNNNSAGATQQYSLSQNNGSGINCALSFKAGF